MFDFPEKQTRRIGNFVAIWAAAVMLAAAVFACNLSGPTPDKVLITPEPDGWFAQLEPVWTFTTDEMVISTPLIAGDRAIIATYHSIYAVDVTDGHILWQTKSANQVASSPAPVLAGTRILVPEMGGTMSVYALSDGKLLWSACPLNLSTDCHNGYSEIQSMAVSDDYVTITLFKQPYFTYRLDTGNREWKSKESVYSSLATDNRYLYVENSYYIEVVSFQDGSILRSIPTYDGSLADLIIDHNALYMARVVGSDLGYVEKLDLDNGDRFWSRPLTDLTHLTYADGILYASADRVYALDAESGEVKWQSNLIGSPGRAVVSDKFVFVRNGSGMLYALDKNTGEQVGALMLKNTTNNNSGDELNPASRDGLLLVPIGSRQIFAYRLN